MSLPKVAHMFSYDTSALDMLRIWGDWNDFSLGTPLHITPSNNGFVTWIGLLWELLSLRGYEGSRGRRGAEH